MRLISLAMENFRAHADTRFAFPAEGLTGLIGTNEAGKSTVLEGITFALFGSKAIRGGMKTLRWFRAPARHVAQVALEFEIGGHSYHIERSETSAELYELPNLQKPIAAGVDAVNKRIPELVGMDLDEFSTTFLTRQRDLAALAAMGGTKRRQFILGVMGLDRIDDGLKACRSKKNDLQRELDGVAVGLGEREPVDSEAKEAARVVQLTQEELEQVQVGHTASEAKAEQARAALATSTEREKRHLYLVQNETHLAAELSREETELERIGRSLEEAASAGVRAENARAALEQLPALRQRRDSLVAARAQIQERTALVARDRQVHGRIEAAAARAQQLESGVAALASASTATAEQAVATLEEQLREARASRDRARAATLEAQTAAEKEAQKAQRKLDAIQAAGADGACPTCTRALGEHFAVVVQALAHEGADARKRGAAFAETARALVAPGDDEQQLQANLRSARERLEQARHEIRERDGLQRDLDNTRRELATAEADLRSVAGRLAELGAVEYDADALTECEVAIEDLEQLDRAAAADRALASQAPQLMTSQDEHLASRTSLTERLELARRELAGLAFDAEEHERLSLATQQAARGLQESTAALARTEEAAHAAAQRLERAERALADYDARAGRLKDLRDQVRVHAAAADRLNDFRTAQAASIRPELEELTTGFVSILTDGRHNGVTLSEDFDVVLQEDGIDAEVVSGGTEDVAALCMRLAISQMIAQRAGHPLSLLILDEPFGSLDEVRRGNVLNLIRQLDKTFAQVLVISHVAETRDAVDSVIELEYDVAGGCTRVVGVPAGLPTAAAAD